MINGKVLINVLLSTLAAAAAGGATSVSTQPVAPWQVHAAAAGMAALTYLVGHLRQSPLSR